MCQGRREQSSYFYCLWNSNDRILARHRMITCISEKEEVLGKAYEERNNNFKQDKGYTNCRKFKKNNSMKNIK